MRNLFYLEHCNKFISKLDADISETLSFIKKFGMCNASRCALLNKSKARATYSRIKYHIENEPQ